jgi:glycosyltransferase involved in cell wall biosynthesis
MRVSIDAIPLLVQSAGVKTYVYHWARSLRRAAGRNTLELFPFLDPPDHIDHEKSVVSRLPTLARLGLLHAANSLRVPILNTIGRRLDVFHSSHQLLSPPRNTRVTATLYDMTCWLQPETHTPANVSMARQFAHRVLRSADGMIAISENTRTDAIRVLGLDPDRVEVIYPGVAEAFFEAKPVARRKPYILFVGTIEPRKNVGALLDAYIQLGPSLRETFDLVIAGPPGWGDPGVRRRLEQAPPGVEYLGYVPEPNLPGLTAGATVFVYPSLYEGFGLPVAQAMAAGVPVITSNVSCLPEIAGDAALLVDPKSVSALRTALETILLSADLRSRLAAAGRQRSSLFRWEACAQRSWRFFENISGKL